MLVKFFSNKQGGSISGINYLLNHRVKDKTAYVIKGSESVTRNIVSGITKKQKLCMGCLSFEEKDIDLKTKQRVIDKFETLLFGGDKDRYNILWVEHTDKQRLELNFAIPKIDLITGLAFNPYYDKVDRKLVDSWQNYTNLRFNISDPKDPSKSHMLQGSRKELNTVKDYIEIERILVDKLINNEFSCRDDILKALKDSNIEATRVGKEYISIKLPNSKKPKDSKEICFMKALQTLQAWTNSEKIHKEEQKSLKIEQMNQILNTKESQIKALQEDLISLQMNLEQTIQENLELSNLNKAYQKEKESSTDSNQNLTMKYKKETTGLKNKLQESQKETRAYQTLSMILFVVIIFLSIWNYSLYSQNKKLKQTNQNMKTYIKQNISGNKQ